jgi:predicted short-subunit dehydrogenase-like oxidoreductase (DUF2520 family)
MKAKFSIAIVGPGRFGTALARALIDAGHQLREIVSGASKTSRQSARALAHLAKGRATTLATANLNANVIWLCVSDRKIEDVAEQLAIATHWKKKIVFHSSGALTSDVLHGLRSRGASVASVHPLMTFVHGSIPSFAGLPFAVEGDVIALGVARQIVSDLGGGAFAVRKRHKTLYHVWGMFTSPLLLSLVVAAEQVGRTAGVPATNIRRKMMPIMMQTLSNYAALGPASSFSGPLVRGDAATVREHLKALKQTPDAKRIYIALAQSALRRLPVKNRSEMEKVLKSLGG